MSRSHDHHDEEEYSLESHLEKWTWEMCCSIYYHRKRSRVRAISWKFLIDIVTYPTESESNRYDDSERIGDIKKSNVMSLLKEKNRYKRAEKSTMKTHPSFPNRKYLVWMIEKIRKIIEYHVSESSSKYNSKKHIHEESIEFFSGNMGKS